MTDRGRPPIVLIDGLPGSGKTTTAREIAAGLRLRGVSCEWEREEARDHPYFGSEIRRQHRRPDYDQICIDRWQLLVDSPEPIWRVFDGCAMQSTVRFMFEQDWPIDRIESYWRRFEQTTRGRAVLVYFTHPAPAAFIRTHTTRVRGDDWPKIADHVRGTPAGRRLEREGASASVEFWVHYRRLCDRLIARSTLPVLTIDVGNGWVQVTDSVLAWLDARPEEC
jgi:hypothetical protein